MEYSHLLGRPIFLSQFENAIYNLWLIEYAESCGFKAMFMVTALDTCLHTNMPLLTDKKQSIMSKIIWDHLTRGF